MSGEQPPDEDCQVCGAAAGSWCKPTCSEQPPPRPRDLVELAKGIVSDGLPRRHDDDVTLVRAVLAQAEELAKLRAALTEALDGWHHLHGDDYPDHPIYKLRRLADGE